MRLFSNVWSENTALFERLMEIHSNSPKLYYGFKTRGSPSFTRTLSFWFCSHFNDNFAHRAFATFLSLTLFSYKSGVPFRSYATLFNRASAQNMGIFWICVQNIWKMAFCAKNQFRALKVCHLP